MASWPQPSYGTEYTKAWVGAKPAHYINKRHLCNIPTLIFVGSHIVLQHLATHIMSNSEGSPQLLGTGLGAAAGGKVGKAHFCSQIPLASIQIT